MSFLINVNGNLPSDLQPVAVSQTESSFERLEECDE